MNKIILPPSDNPRRKQWEGFFNGTQESLDYINRMTDCCDKIYKSEQDLLSKKIRLFQNKKSKSL
jgi:hypothetical protein